MKYLRRIQLAFSLSVLAITANSYAQEPVVSDERGAIDEIIVTARKREENLQESPVAISAFSANTLREAGVSTVRDLQALVPGLSITEQGAKAPSIFIRGIGQRESNATLDPSVGVYINGIFISRTDNQLLDTVDTESIQVLRGPQGTLFGKNTTGGAILVSTISPNTEAFSGTASTRLGNFGRRDVKLSMNIPLVEDSLAMRFSVNSVKRDGYLDNTLDGRTFGDEDRIAATARVLWEPSDIFTADLFTYFSETNENGAAFTCLFANPESNLAGQLSYPTGVGSNLDTFRSACNSSEELAKDNKVAVNISESKMTSELMGLSLSWDLDDFEIKSITGVGQQQDIVSEDDPDGTSIEALQSGFLTLESYLGNSGIPVDEEKRTQLSQEIDLIGSAFDDTLSYTLGLFYSSENLDGTPYTQAVGPGTFAVVNLLGPVTIHQLLGTQSDLDTSTGAAFSQVTYDFSELLQITVGARYTEESRERDLSVYSVDLAELASRTGASAISIPIDGLQWADVAAINAGYQQYADGSLQIPVLPDPARDKDDDTWQKFTPAATLSFNNLENYIDWNKLDTALGYVTYSTGFKAGGFEPKGTELVSFEPEEVTNYEIGFKVDAFDHRLRVNSAFYYMEYNDMQTRVAEAGEKITDLYLYLTNAGEATVEGFELEVTGQPMDNLSVIATFNYTKGKYQEFDTPIYKDFQVTTIDRSDEPFGGTPEKSGSLMISYDIATESAGVFVPRLSVVYRDDLYVGLDYLAPEYDQSWLGSYTLINARLDWMPDDDWTITAFVDNLADENYFQGGYAVMDTLGAATVVKGPGTAYGIIISRDF